jgi:hypothetical protein
MRTLAFLALCGLALSAVVHIAGYFGIDVQSAWPSVWLLHVGIFIVFIPMVLVASSESQAERNYGYFPGLSLSTGISMGVLATYATINFFIFAGESMNGSAAMHNGEFVLEHRGKIIRTLSSEEFKDRRAAEVRGMSGHWLLFYYLPFVFFNSRTKS